MEVRRITGAQDEPVSILPSCLGRRWSRVLRVGAGVAMVVTLGVQPVFGAVQKHACPDGEWQLVCDLDNCPHPLDFGEDAADRETPLLADVYLEDLERATKWLWNLDFRGLDIESVAGRCKAHISQMPDGVVAAYYWPTPQGGEGAQDATEGDNPSEAEPPAQNEGEAAAAQSQEQGIGQNPELHLHADIDAYLEASLEEPDEEDRDEEAALKAQERDFGFGVEALFAPVHEIFHGVQGAYAPGIKTPGTEYHWITEGSAEAVMLQYIREHEPGNLASGIGERRFDRPLHLPDLDSSKEDQAWLDYGTSAFWLGVGRRIESPSNIKYLKDVLEKIAAGEGGRPAGPGGLGSVDDALEAHGGLYALLPAFFGDIEWTKDTFGDPHELPAVRLEGGERTRSWTIPERRSLEVREVAGEWLRLEADPGPRDTPVELGIWIEPEGEGGDDLHLLVDRTLVTGVTKDRYRRILAPGEAATLDLVVANVARAAAESEPHEFRIGVDMSEVDGSCRVSAEVTGDVQGRHAGESAMWSTEGMATIYGAVSRPEGVGEGGETLGLLASAPPEVDPDASAMEAMGQMTSGFSMEALAHGVPLEPGYRGAVPLTYLRVFPGVRATETLEGVPFTWIQGAPAAGSANLEITYFDGELLIGTITGHLYSEGYVDPATRQPDELDVSIELTARTAPYGCYGLDGR